MSTTILATKLFIPPPPRTAVRRPRLLARLDAGLHAKLTIVSAPPGSGKTTLVSAWLPHCGRQAAWLSLDEGDSDPVRFLAYLIAALRTVTPDLGAGILDALDSAAPPPVEAILTALINEIAALPDGFVLVLDDYHLVEAEAVDRALAFLIEHLPPRVHVVIATRADPSLPLGRLRVRGHLSELRAADLRFTPDEAAAFLNEAMGLGLTAADVAALEARTEGWIAGLQLAALSLRGREDTSGFIRAFAGEHRHIADYLVEEVLRRQPKLVRDFLLETAILDRLTGPLCDAVTGGEDGDARLESLERANLFVVPLDDARRWYRYHHLFADVLRARLAAERPALVAPLHRRASTWYERNGAMADAIRHALLAGDVERAADLIELTIPAMRRARQDATVRGWLRALPDAVIRVRPVLSVAHAWTLVAAGELAEAESWLQDAECWLEPTVDGDERPRTPPDGMVVVDAEEFRLLPGAIPAYRAIIAHLRGDLAAAAIHAHRALDLAPEDDHLRRGAVAALLGIAAWGRGELEAAYEAYADGMVRLRLAGNLADATGGTTVLADIRIAQGKLRDAMRLYEESLYLASDGGESIPRERAALQVGMAELQHEWNDLDTAAGHLGTSEELAGRVGFMEDRSRWCVALARIREARSDLDGALEMLDEAERAYRHAFYPDVRPVAALRARVWIAQGRVGEALGWVRGRDLTADDELSYLREYEHITLARVLLARYWAERGEHVVREAVGLLGRLLTAADAGGRAGSAIEILVLQALAHHTRGDLSAALTPLARALTLAEPEGYVRIFVDEGSPMMELLEHAAKRGIAPTYIRQLRAAFGTTERSVPAGQNLIEPLSERERDVLRLLATELSGPEMARALFVSLNTLRTHTKNIYTKLGVNTRQAAVRRARELDLL